MHITVCTKECALNSVHLRVCTKEYALKCVYKRVCTKECDKDVNKRVCKKECYFSPLPLKKKPMYKNNTKNKQRD